MQPKPLPPPPGQPALPIEIPRRAGLPPGTGEAILGRCAPEEAWETLGPPARDRLRETWLRVLKGMVGDAQDR